VTLNLTAGATISSTSVAIAEREAAVEYELSGRRGQNLGLWPGASDEGTLSERSMNRQVFAIFAAFLSFMLMPFGLQRRQALNPARSASAIVVWNGRSPLLCAARHKTVGSKLLLSRPNKRTHDPPCYQAQPPPPSACHSSSQLRVLSCCLPDSSKAAQFSYHRQPKQSLVAENAAS
jgi:hypothetical protein